MKQQYLRVRTAVKAGYRVIVKKIRLHMHGI